MDEYLTLDEFNRRRRAKPWIERAKKVGSVFATAGRGVAIVANKGYTAYQQSQRPVKGRKKTGNKKGLARQGIENAYNNLFE